MNHRVLGLALVFLFLAGTAVPPVQSQSSPQTGVITTIAGGWGAVGDGFPATEALLMLPEDVAVDGSGNLFIADTRHSRIRTVDTSGVISTVAGMGSGYSGDGGPATLARLSYPTGVAVDATGAVFIADSGNHRIRKVDASGTITTLAGTGGRGYSGDGGAAVDAQLNLPAGVAVDASGNVFIADMHNQRIRRVDTSGIITTVVGTGTAGHAGDGGPATSAQLSYPNDVVVDASGNLFIADSNGVRKVSKSSGVITTVGGSGPRGVTVDAAGNLFFAEHGNRRVRRIDPSGTITTVAGVGSYGDSGDGGPATSAQLADPSGVAVDASGVVFIADTENHRVRKVDAAGVITTVAGVGWMSSYTGDGGPAVRARLIVPAAIAVDTAGDLFIADKGNRRIRKVDAAGVITTVAGTGTAGYSGDGGLATDAMLRNPADVCTGAAGNLFIADASDHRIRKVDPSGTITTVVGTGAAGYGGDGGPAVEAQLRLPFGVAVDAVGNLFIADTENHRIRKVDAQGIITTIAGNGTGGYDGDGGGAIDAQLYTPWAIAVDAGGNLFIADYSNNRIRKVDTAGIITTVAGTSAPGYGGDGGPAIDAQLRNPSDVAFDGSGNLLIADRGNQRIRKIDRSGVITTVAGVGTAGYSGDGGPATSAHLWSPRGVAVDASGSLFIADQNSYRIRKVTYTHTITASAGAGGSISPSGDVVVNYGANQTFNVTPAAGYAVADVLVDGASVGAVTTYTFSSVTADHAISASFRVTYTSLSSLVATVVTKPGVVNSLLAKLDAAQKAEARGNADAKAGTIAAFINEVQAQAGKAVSAGNAALLIALAGGL